MFYLVNKSEDLNPEDSVSAISKDCSGEVRKELLEEFLQLKPGSWNIKTSLLIEENQTPQVLYHWTTWEAQRNYTLVLNYK